MGRSFVPLAVLGGVAFVALVSYVGTYVDPLAAAVCWSFPFSLVAVLWIMREEGKPDAFLGEFARTATYTQVLQVIASLALARFLMQGQGTFWTRVLQAGGVWLAGGVVFYWIARWLGVGAAFRRLGR
jgi:hypothetical protein